MTVPLCQFGIGRNRGERVERGADPGEDMQESRLDTIRCHALD
jgi:hypothetical protein